MDCPLRLPACAFARQLIGAHDSSEVGERLGGLEACELITGIRAFPIAAHETNVESRDLGQCTAGFSEFSRAGGTGTGALRCWRWGRVCTLD